MNLLSEAHIFRIYDQGVDAIVRLIARLVDRIEELEARYFLSSAPLTELLEMITPAPPDEVGKREALCASLNFSFLVKNMPIVSNFAQTAGTGSTFNQSSLEIRLLRLLATKSARGETP